VENWKCFTPQSWSCFKKHCLPEVRHADLQRTSKAAWNHLASGWKELSPVARCSLLFPPPMAACWKEMPHKTDWVLYTNHSTLREFAEHRIESQNAWSWKGPLKATWSNSSATNRNSYSSIRCSEPIQVGLKHLQGWGTHISGQRKGFKLSYWIGLLFRSGVGGAVCFSAAVYITDTGTCTYNKHTKALFLSRGWDPAALGEEKKKVDAEFLPVLM